MKFRRSLAELAVSALALSPTFALATIHYTTGLNITNSPNFGGGNTDGTGVWFDPLTGYAEARGSTFPDPLFEDGKYMLVMDSQFTQTEAEVWTEGFFSRGNNVLGSGSGNPARLGDGAVVGPGFTNASFTDLGPTFGNWAAGGHGFIGLVMRDPAGASASNVFYGYAEINVNADYSTTLISMAYNDVEGAPITTVNTTPEPTVLLPLAAFGLALRRRREV